MYVLETDKHLSFRTKSSIDFRLGTRTCRNYQHQSHIWVSVTLKPFTVIFQDIVENMFTTTSMYYTRVRQPICSVNGRIEAKGWLFKSSALHLNKVKPCNSPLPAVQLGRRQRWPRQQHFCRFVKLE